MEITFLLKKVTGIFEENNTNIMLKVSIVKIKFNNNSNRKQFDATIELFWNAKH